MKNHQPNMPDPDYVGKSMSKSKYADSMVEMDARVGHIMDKLRELGIDKNTLVVWTTDNGAWQDVYPDAGYTPFRGTKGTDREGGSRVPAIAWWPGKIKEHSRNHDIVGGLDLMATFASVAGIKLPTKDRAGQPIIFDSYDISPVLFGTGKDPRTSWFYFTENELTRGRRASVTIRRCLTCAAITARKPAAWRWIPTSAGKGRSRMSQRCRRFSTSGRIRRNATISL